RAGAARRGGRGAAPGRGLLEAAARGARAPPPDRKAEEEAPLEPEPGDRLRQVAEEVAVGLAGAEVDEVRRGVADEGGAEVGVRGREERRPGVEGRGGPRGDLAEEGGVAAGRAG